MAVSRETKLDWFDAGAEALHRQGQAPEGSATAPPEYVCPICVQAFPRSAVGSGQLTADHVPPESVGGRELVLTCRKCNNIAGTTLDAHAHLDEQVSAAVALRPGASLKVKVHVAGEEVNADLVRTDEGWQLQRPKKPHANRPGAWDRLPMHRGDTGMFEFPRYSELAVNISWLKSGYLALFAVVGYPVVFDPAFDLVRRQIREPERSLSLTWGSEVPSPAPWKAPMLAEVIAPESQRGWAVLFGSRYVLFPHLGDTSFYERLAATAGRYVEIECRVLAWPTKPLFGLPESGKV